MTKYLALDQALQTTGFAAFDEKELIEVGSFSISANKNIEERLGIFEERLDQLYKVYNFDCLFFEDIQKQQNVETFKRLSYVQATVLLWCWRNNIPYTILSPSHWRLIIKGHYKVNFGRSRKEQKQAAQNFISTKYNLNSSEDECDAVCIGLAGIHELNTICSAF